METDGVKFYSILTGVVIILIVILVFAIRGLTRTVEINVNTTDMPVEETPVETPETTEVTSPEPSASETPDVPVADADQALIDTLQKMADSGTIYKTGSKGADVAALQNFLNKYNKTTTTVDSDFGNGLTAAIKTYQSKNGLPVTGQVAGKTLGKMVEWLKAN